MRLSKCLLLLCCIAWAGCGSSDQEHLLGKWQSERDWFDFHQNMTYDSGKDDIKMVSSFRYTIDPATHELNLYTDDANSTYYLIYEFRGKDTLAVRNALSTAKTMIPFVRVK